MEFMLSSKLFWGAIVVLAGLVIIANAVFNINIPIFRVFFALLLIYWGVKMLIDIRPKQVETILRWPCSAKPITKGRH